MNQKYLVYDETMKELYERGSSTIEIGKILEIPSKTVGRHLAKLRVPLRKCGRQRGSKLSEAAKLKCRLTKLAERNPNWKGNNIKTASGRERARRWYKHDCPPTNYRNWNKYPLRVAENVDRNIDPQGAKP